MDIGSVSSDDVIRSYQRQLSEANQQIAVLEAQLAKAAKIIGDRETAARIIREGEPGE